MSRIRALRILLIVAVVSLVLAAMSCGASSDGTQSKVYKQTIAAGTATSSGFLQAVAYASIVNKYATDIHVDVTSAWQGGEAKGEAMRRKIVDTGSQSNYDMFRQSYLGTGPWEGKGRGDHIRIFALDSPMVEYVIVRADSGITKFEDLNGKPYAAGSVGTQADLVNRLVCEIAGVKPNFFTGNLDNITTAMKDKRIVGMNKAAAGIQLDAAMLDIQSTTPIRIIPIPKPVMEQTFKKIGSFSPVLIKKGQIKAMADTPDFYALGYVQGISMTTDVPQRVAYKMAKIVDEHWAETSKLMQRDTFPDLMKGTVEYMMEYHPDEEACPLHAGTMQYLKERGITVPAKLIPPEWKN